MNTFEYLAVLVSIVVGLGVTHILGAIGRVVSQPNGQKLFWVHSIWTLYALLALIYFWWFELRFSGVREWSGVLYVFVIGYAIALYLLSAIIVPVDPQLDYRVYYFSRRTWILCFLLAIQVIDVADTYLKSAVAEAEINLFLPQRGIMSLSLLGGMMTDKAWYHGFLALSFVAIPVLSLLVWTIPG
jgi:hypothetical protein